MDTPTSSENGTLLRQVGWLRANPQFASLPDEVLRDLARNMRLIRYEHGDRITSRGDEMRLTGVVVRGGVRSSFTSFDGHELSMSILRRGAFYGWMGIVEPTLSPWDVSAHGSTELATMFVSEFRTVMDRHPTLTMMIARALNNRLRKAYAHMGNLVLDDLEARLRRTLLMLAGDRTKFTDQEQPSITITQEALGHFVQCSRPTVNKLLRELEKAGLIELGYGVIRIRNLEALYPSLEGSFHLL